MSRRTPPLVGTEADYVADEARLVAGYYAALLADEGYTYANRWLDRELAELPSRLEIDPAVFRAAVDAAIG